jgi:hypothetical protein
MGVVLGEEVGGGACPPACLPACLPGCLPACAGALWFGRLQVLHVHR